MLSATDANICSVRRRSQDDYEAVMALMRRGYGDSEVARRTGVPRSTISAWRNGRGVTYHQRLSGAPSWRPTAPAAYCYLLGLYLGDGYIHVSPTGFATIVITLDASFPGIVDEGMAALRACFPETPVHWAFQCDGSVAAVKANHPALPFALPHHGAGPKHQRPIELQTWQRRLTYRFPRALLRGLIHSDGCRTINRFKTRLPSGRLAKYEYPRHFFSNLSGDIRSIFCEHCELLGIRWTQSNPRNISVAHRRSVALMDEFIGPKT
jgi:hypothetical protein